MLMMAILNMEIMVVHLIVMYLPDGTNIYGSRGGES